MRGNCCRDFEARCPFCRQPVLKTEPHPVFNQEKTLLAFMSAFRHQYPLYVIFCMLLKSAQDDWQLRGAFFDSIVGVAAYVGWQSSIILKPLLQQVTINIYTLHTYIHAYIVVCTVVSVTIQSLVHCVVYA